MTFKLGLTGSIGMGKSTTANMFAELGCSVWDADAAVHRIYGPGGAAVPEIQRLFPDAVVDGAVSRDILKQRISEDSAVLKTLEGIVHPLVRADREQFTSNAVSQILVFDIPLLFETGSEAEFDAVACVLVSAEEQTARVMERGTMTLEQLEIIRSKQLPAEDKAARSDYVIRTDTLDNTRRKVVEVIGIITGKLQNA